MLFDGLVSQVIQLVESGKEVVIVSSGAIALGMHALGIKERPKELKYLQAAAAIGQNALMNAYHSAFSKKGYIAAQILLTWEDFNDRQRYKNARHTLVALLDRSRYKKLRPIPVINENDTVATDEIKFGDNDRLSALVASVIPADFLLILSDVDGLLDGEKNLIPLVDKINAQVKALACPTEKKTCVGGMITKLDAARIAVDSGIPCVIANGRKRDIIVLASGYPEAAGTFFCPQKKLKARERWIAFGTKPKGAIIVDEGAKQALLGNKSLLAVGIADVQGDFEAQSVIGILDPQGNEFARGKVCVASGELRRIKKTHYHKEIIHSNDLVLM